MLSFSNFKDVGSFVDGAFAGYAAATAGGAGDATEADGPWIDRRGHDSCAVFIGYRGVLAAAATLSVAANLQDAADSSGTGAADFGAALANAVRDTGGGGGTTETGVLKLKFDLTEARRYIRLQMTPNLSAANTDTAILFAFVVLGPGPTPIGAALN